MMYYKPRFLPAAALALGTMLGTVPGVGPGMGQERRDEPTALLNERKAPPPTPALDKLRELSITHQRLLARLQAMGKPLLHHLEVMLDKQKKCNRDGLPAVLDLGGIEGKLIVDGKLNVAAFYAYKDLAILDAQIEQSVRDIQTLAAKTSQEVEFRRDEMDGDLDYIRRKMAESAKAVEAIAQLEPLVFDVQKVTVQCGFPPVAPKNGRPEVRNEWTMTLGGQAFNFVLPTLEDLVKDMKPYQERQPNAGVSDPKKPLMDYIAQLRPVLEAMTVQVAERVKNQPADTVERAVQLDKDIMGCWERQGRVVGVTPQGEDTPLPMALEAANAMNDRAFQRFEHVAKGQVRLLPSTGTPVEILEAITDGIRANSSELTIRWKLEELQRALHNFAEVERAMVSMLGFLDKGNSSRCVEVETLDGAPQLVIGGKTFTLPELPELNSQRAGLGRE